MTGVCSTWLLAAIMLMSADVWSTQDPAPPPADNALAVVDLGTPEGLTQLQGQWRYRDARIVEADFKAAGDDQQPTGRPVRTYDISPHAGGKNFDDTGWTAIDATTLMARRGHGRLAFNWYRIRLTVPERIGDVDPRGTTLVFETSVDDYAEIWVDGELPRAAGQRGGSVISGWNAPNRLVIARNVQPGQQIQLAVFGANGPLSNPPTNYIYLRYARLEFHRGGDQPYAVAPHEVNVEVLRKDPALDALVPPNPKLFKLAEGFQFTEGPVWINEGNSDGHLLFSDPNANRIYKYSNRDGLQVFREHSGYAGADIAEYRQPGSNGLALDAQGRLTVNQHGNRRVVRFEANGQETVLAERFLGKRLNSPNDLVYKKDGTLYFTDPFFGLPKFDQDPRKELPYSGIFRVRNGQVELLSADLVGPNGIAFSPDERYLYVGNWDPKRKVVMRYPVQPDGTLGRGETLFDVTGTAGEDAIDGIKVDQVGNLYVSAPGGLWILSPAGKHLGTVVMPRHPHNLAWGDNDGKTLYLTAESGLYRMRLNVAGAR